MSLTKLSLAGKNLIIPGQGEFGKWLPGWGRESCLHFFTVYCCYLVRWMPGNGNGRGRQRFTPHVVRGRRRDWKIHQISACNIERAFDLLKGQCHEMVWDFFALNRKCENIGQNSVELLLVFFLSGFINIETNKSLLKLAVIFVSYLLWLIIWNSVVLVINFNESRLSICKSSSQWEAKSTCWTIHLTNFGTSRNMQNICRM